MSRRAAAHHPGEILREEFLVPLGLTQKELADHLGCDVKVINRIVNGRTSVTAGDGAEARAPRSGRRPSSG